MQLTDSIIITFTKTPFSELVESIRDKIADKFFYGNKLMLPAHITIIKWNGDFSISPKSNCNYFKSIEKINIAVGDVIISDDLKNIWFPILDQLILTQTINQLYEYIESNYIDANNNIFLSKNFHVSLAHGINDTVKVSQILDWICAQYHEVIPLNKTIVTDKLCHCKISKKHGWFIYQEFT